MLAWMLTICCAVSGHVDKRKGDFVDRVDIIELNSYHDDKGRYVFDQWLFWSWGYNDKHNKWRYDIVDWRLAKDIRRELSDEEKKQIKAEFAADWLKEHPKKGAEIPELIINPILDWEKIHLQRSEHSCVLIFKDPKQNVWRTVHGRMFKHTETRYDPELTEREFLLEGFRKKLKQPKEKQKTETKY